MSNKVFLQICGYGHTASVWLGGLRGSRWVAGMRFLTNNKKLKVRAHWSAADGTDASDESQYFYWVSTLLRISAYGLTQFISVQAVDLLTTWAFPFPLRVTPCNTITSPLSQPDSPAWRKKVPLPESETELPHSVASGADQCAMARN